MAELTDRVCDVWRAGTQAQAPALRRACRRRAASHGLRAVEAARKALAAQAAVGDDPRRSTREHPGRHGEAWFKREIAPKLDAFYARGYRKRDGLIARGLLANPSRGESTAPAALGSSSYVR